MGIHTVAIRVTFACTRDISKGTAISLDTDSRSVTRVKQVGQVPQAQN